MGVFTIISTEQINSVEDKLEEIHAEFDQPYDTEWVYDLVVTGTKDGCPCAYEVWSTHTVNGKVAEEDWYIIYQQSNCR